eukprot:TRINITY_DN2287_c0_g1_i1.p2 TRINITY_DN2287_c0_g1~~TRINITY_DN2287_c0_g1_i1.p2  ORF type:complete len:291 (+),score=114.41 TRINITY_DN2287_c0_g1_i1:61-933(+)
MGKASKDKRDIYYRKAKEEGWRARSAYKLLQVNDEYDVFRGVSRAVDLCAAPGSWSQVLSRELRKEREEGDDARIVSVDLQEMAPIDGVKILQGDITEAGTARAIVSALGDQKADLVISDGAPDVTGMHDLDEYIQLQLVLAALNITNCVLSPGGSFVAKIFRGRSTSLLYTQLKCFFENVTTAKPKSSRNQSAEAFVVCQGHRLPEHYNAMDVLVNPMHHQAYDSLAHDATGPGRYILPFINCGDLSAYDSERAYELDSISAPAVAPPLDPPYKDACTLKRKRGDGEEP